MNTWRIDGLALKARQFLIFMLAAWICASVALAPARADDLPPSPEVTPKLLGSFNTDHAHGVEIAGTTAYVSDSGSGLQIIDASNPAAPTLLGSFDTPDIAFGVAIADTTAYVVDGDSGLQIIDITRRR